MAEMQLNDDQRNRLSEITNGATANFAAGYRYISSIISSHPNAGMFVQQNYWLSKAIEINSNDQNSKANTFIREVTRAGLLWDGKPADPNTVQNTSDLIARKVIRDTIVLGRLASIDTIIKDDAVGATSEGGQTIAGWGGTFNYWNVQLSDNPSDTVGARVRSNPAEYEKFIAVTARATAAVMEKFGPINVETALTAVDTTLPSKEFGDIVNRVGEALLDGYGFAGDPNYIDGYTPKFNDNDTVIGWQSRKPDLSMEGVSDPVLAHSLSVRRNVKLSKSVDQAWEARATSSTRITFPGGTIVTREYSNDNLLTCSIQKPNGTNVRVDLNALSGLPELCAIKDSQNRLMQKLSFDGAGRITSKVTYDSSGSEPWANRTISYDKAGNVVLRRIGYDDGKTTRTTYDPLDNAPWKNKTITYDANDRRIREVVVNDNGSKTGTTFNAVTQAVVGSISFNADGSVSRETGSNGGGGAWNANGDGDGNGANGSVSSIGGSNYKGGPSTNGGGSNYNGGYTSGGISRVGEYSFDPSTNTTRYHGTYPVGIDLNRDGAIDLRAVSELTGSPKFDWDADGIPDGTGWVGPSDGWLAIDLGKGNADGADGAISQVAELSFSSWVTDSIVTDMEALDQIFDTNNNSMLDSGDARWNEFRIWQDVNQNGTSEVGELRTLEQADIRLINLVPSTAGSTFLEDGSAITGTSSYTRSDGSYGLAGDITVAYRSSKAIS